MPYHLVFSKTAKKQLFKLDKNQSKIIINWLETYIDNTYNPKVKGKALKDNLGGLWRYRIGKYRIICEIKENELIVEALGIGHRRNVYKK